MHRPRKRRANGHGQEPRHRETACHEQQGAQGKAAIYRQLHDAVGRIRPFAQRGVPPAVQQAVPEPERKLRKAEHLVHALIGEQQRAAHERD